MTAYVPEHKLATDTDNGLLLVISGPSGVGKTTITRAIERSIPDAYFSVSVTTRPRSGMDVDGIDYWFIEDSEFERRVASNEFLEYAVYNGNKYGTLSESVDAQLGRGRLVILEIDVQGAKLVKKRMPEAYGIFIEPPGEDALLERLRLRRRESEEEILRRFELAKQEISEAHACGAYDAFIVNDDLNRAVEQALALIGTRRGASAAR